jgi:hypothetical protein
LSHNLRRELLLINPLFYKFDWQRADEACWLPVIHHSKGTTCRMLIPPLKNSF